MAHLLEAFEIELPAGINKSALASMRQELAQIPGINKCGQSATRSLDPATLTMWITLAGTAVTALGQAIPVIKQIVDLFKRKGIKGLKLKLANGSVLEADEINAEELLKFEQKS